MGVCRGRKVLGFECAVQRSDPKHRVINRARCRIFFQQFQRQLNTSGPYFPLMQPTQVFVGSSDLNNAVYNAVYQVDVTKVAPK